MEGQQDRDGRAVQVNPIKPMLKAPGTKRLKLEYAQQLTFFAFRFNLRCYTMGRSSALWTRSATHSPSWTGVAG
jgi:hypothetical protein